MKIKFWLPSKKKLICFLTLLIEVSHSSLLVCVGFALAAFPKSGHIHHLDVWWVLNLTCTT